VSNARDRAAKLRRRDAPPPEETPVPKQRPEPPKKVRQTVDISGERHLQLAAWKFDTALTLGRSRLSVQDVLSATIDVLLDDEQMARRVRARLEEQEE
jgi:hypothetical protein